MLVVILGGHTSTPTQNTNPFSVSMCAHYLLFAVLLHYYDLDEVTIQHHKQWSGNEGTDRP